jgi:hypothetical protein
MIYKEYRVGCRDERVCPHPSKLLSARNWDGGARSRILTGLVFYSSSSITLVMESLKLT